MDLKKTGQFIGSVRRERGVSVAALLAASVSFQAFANAKPQRAA